MGGVSICRCWAGLAAGLNAASHIVPIASWHVRGVSICRCSACMAAGLVTGLAEFLADALGLAGLAGPGQVGRVFQPDSLHRVSQALPAWSCTEMGCAGAVKLCC